MRSQPQNVLLVASLGEEGPKGTHYLPGLTCVVRSRQVPWHRAANDLLDRFAQDKSLGDGAFFADDDVEILPTTMDLWEKYRGKADMIGFGLLGPYWESGGYWVQSSGHMLTIDWGLKLEPLDNNPHALFLPVYLAHAGTCLCWLSRDLVEAGVRFPAWEGIHFEDVAFCLEAWLSGFRVMRLPTFAYHHGHKSGAGRTKGSDPQFAAKRLANYRRLEAWMKEREVRRACMEGRIPIGVRHVG